MLWCDMSNVHNETVLISFLLGNKKNKQIVTSKKKICKDCYKLTIYLRMQMCLKDTVYINIKMFTKIVYYFPHKLN